MKLREANRSNDDVLNFEIEELRPKMGNLRNMAEKLVKIFVGQKSDVEPEMEMLGQRYDKCFCLSLLQFHHVDFQSVFFRWSEIIKDVEERLAKNKPFKMVSHMHVATGQTIAMPNLNDVDEEIDTLPETELIPHRPPSSHYVGEKYVKKPSTGNEVFLPALSSGESSPDLKGKDTLLLKR